MGTPVTHYLTPMVSIRCGNTAFTRVIVTSVYHGPQYFLMLMTIKVKSPILGRFPEIICACKCKYFSSKLEIWAAVHFWLSSKQAIPMRRRRKKLFIPSLSNSLWMHLGYFVRICICNDCKTCTFWCQKNIVLPYIIGSSKCSFDSDNFL